MLRRQHRLFYSCSGCFCFLAAVGEGTINLKNVDNIREIVLNTLLTLEQEGNYSHKLIKAVLDKYNYWEERDRAFLKRVTEGTLERQLELDYYLNYYSRVAVQKMRPLIRCLMRMSVYQILYMDGIPDSAVCNEACKLAAKRGFHSLKGYVNGVLRTISREKEKLPLPDENEETVQYFSVKYSMPQWLVELWLGEYGRKITATLLKGLMEIHPVSIRFISDLSQEERERWSERMEKQGVELVQSRDLPYIYFIRQWGNCAGPAALQGFEEGVCTVQDVSSALAVEAAGIKTGDFVMDVCAAPGGKSILAGEKVGAGRVLARDVSEAKVALIEENLRRMKAKNIDTECFDATQPCPGYEGKADVVLLDVPCSGLGVMGKKRDIKYRISKEKMEGLRQLQEQIARTCVSYVKPGGILLYSTCTIHSEENERMVRFIIDELGMESVSLEETLPESVLAQKKLLEEELRSAGKEPMVKLTKEESAACIQLLPGYMEADGFFIARFRRK